MWESQETSPPPKAQQPLVGQGPLIIEVLQRHTHTHTLGRIPLDDVNNCPTRSDYIYTFYYASAASSTCFGWYPHPSSGAHTNCNYNIWHCSNSICYLPLTRRSRNYNAVPTPRRQRTVANTVRPVPDVITVWVCSWWRMRVSSETCRAVCRNIIKTVYSRILFDSYWHRTLSWNFQCG